VHLLLESTRQSDGPGDVDVLRRFVAADKQQQEDGSALRVVHPVARPDIDLQFGDTVRQIAVRSGVAVNQAIDANQNPCPSSAVSQPVDPLAVLVGLLNTRGTQCSS
jgi:hypothetical protein